MFVPDRGGFTIFQERAFRSEHCVLHAPVLLTTFFPVPFLFVPFLQEWAACQEWAVCKNRMFARMGLRIGDEMLMFYRTVKACCLIAVAAAAVMSILPEPAHAQSRAASKWCLRGPSGSSACLYRTFDQCRTAAHGTGATCMRNSRYRGG